jgi:hypothetical protein
MPAPQPPPVTPEGGQATPFTSEAIFWIDSILSHIRMMHWVWIPGFLFAGVLAIRYAALPVMSRTASPLAIIGWGMVGSVSRARALDSAAGLRRPALALQAVASLVASQTIVVYHLVVLLFFFGIEFVLGQVAGALVMIPLLGAGVRYVLSPAAGATQGMASDGPAAALSDAPVLQVPSWRDVILTRGGWKGAFRYLGREIAGMLIPLVVGILIGAAILAAGREGWTPQLAALVHREGPVTDVLSALIGPLLAVLIPVPPVGNLIVADGIWKIWAVEYPGLLGFTLASVLNPLLIPAYARLWGRRNVGRFLLVLYLSVVVSSLVVTGVFDLFGLRPGHVPWFRALVDTIMNWMPFAMPMGPSMAPMK